MSWLGLRHKGVEILTPEEWNLVVDGLDILYRYSGESVKYRDLPSLPSDVAPSVDAVYSLGSKDRAWRTVYAHYGYFLDDAYVQGRRVLKDGDPVTVYYFEGPAREEVERIYSLLADVSGRVDLIEEYVQRIYQQTRRPLSIRTQRLLVGSTPVPLSEIDTMVKRIHVKVPSWAMYLVYLGSEENQDYILEPGDREVFEIENPRRIYVRSLGSVEIFIAFEE